MRPDKVWSGHTDLHRSLLRRLSGTILGGDGSGERGGGRGVSKLPLEQQEKAAVCGDKRPINVDAFS